MAGPLTKKDLAEAKAGLYDCRCLVQDIDKAKACGIECAEHDLRNSHLMQFFQAVLENYSPDREPIPET